MKEYRLGTSREHALSLFPENVIKRINLEERSLAGVRIGEKIYVFNGSCPHRGASLVEGWINSLSEIICPLHEYRFDLSTGNLRVGSCGDLEVYRTQIDSSGLKIFVP